jgi:hypothetical protein
VFLWSRAEDVVKDSLELQHLFGAVDKQEVEAATARRLLRHRMTR